MPDDLRQPAPSARTLKLTLAYDGTPFVGWQRQAEGVSIQGLVEDVLTRLDGAPVTVFGAGRTDAGVHACGQVASARMTSRLDEATLRRAANAMLPSEVRVVAVEKVADSFHARYSAVAKTYHYAMVAGPVVLPFEWRYCWSLPERLDVEAMSAAAVLFEGEHDFAAFRAAGSSVKTSRRLVLHSRVRRVGAVPTPFHVTADPAVGGERLVYEVTATGFLRHMVRALVGTLVEIGLGRLDGAAIASALVSGRRGEAGPTAPARGLCLVKVEYPPTGAGR